MNDYVAVKVSVLRDLLNHELEYENGGPLFNESDYWTDEEVLSNYLKIDISGII